MIQYLTTKDALKQKSKTLTVVIGSRRSRTALAGRRRKAPDAGTISRDAEVFRKEAQTSGSCAFFYIYICK